MNRVIAYVDGFNLYYGLRSKEWKQFYWLNIQDLLQQLGEQFSLPVDSSEFFAR